MSSPMSATQGAPNRPGGPPEATIAFDSSSASAAQTDSFAVDSDQTQAFAGNATTAPVGDRTQVAPGSPSDVLLSGDPNRQLDGPILLGDYEVVQKLGQGGMGAVFKARQRSLDRDVALKVLARHLVDNKEYVARFYREAKVMAKLDHENIIRCYSVGESQGLHYLAMEFVDGGSLQSWLDKLGRFSVGDAVLAVLDVARGLQHAHEQNLVHRDVKPDNALITRKGVVKVADLGLAKPQDDDLGLTATGVGAGTPHFMSPEQMRNAKDVDGRTDIYALGCMLYTMLTGERPFRGTTLVELIKEKEAGKFTPARRLNPEIPDRLDLMIDKMIDKNPKTRYQTCADLIRDLEALGVASKSLSFIEGAVPKTSSQIRRAVATPTVPAASSTSVGSSPKMKAPVAAPSRTEAASPPQPAGMEDIWYISAGVVDGKRRVKKMTTYQVMDAIHAKTLDGKVEASRQANSGYRALMSYSEFTKLLQQKAQKATVERRTVMTSAEASNIAKEAIRHQNWRWLRNLGKSLLEWIYLLIGLGALAGVGLLVFLYWDRIMKMIQG